MITKRKISDTFCHFSVNKNIRFEWIPLFENNYIFSKSSDFEKDFHIFLEKYKQLLHNFSSIIFYQQKPNTKLKIKFSFFKKFTQYEYYEYKIDTLKNKHNNQIYLWQKETQYFYGICKEFYDKNMQLLEKISLLSFEAQDIWYFFHQIMKKNNFDFVQELFFDNINTENPYVYELIKNTKNILKELFLIQKKLKNQIYSKTRFGNVIEYANFNYYLVNKEEKNYKELVQKKETTLLTPVLYFSHLSPPNEKNWLKDLEAFYQVEYKNLSLEKAYEAIKFFKSMQKENFLKFLSKWYSHEDFLRAWVLLFSDISKENYNELAMIWKKINFLSKITKNYLHLNLLEKLQMYENMFQEKIISGETDVQKIIFLLKWKIWYFKKLKSNFFSTENPHHIILEKYRWLCKEYKKISLELWKQKAQLKEIKLQQKQQEMQKAWAVVLDEKDKKYLVIISKFSEQNNIKKAHDFLYQHSDHSYHNFKITCFESLNIKILNTLCFTKEASQFRKDIGKELYEKYPQFVEKKVFQKQNKTLALYNLKMKHELPIDSLLCFYKNILQLENIKKHIIIEDFHCFEEFIKKDFISLEDFEIQLKKTCYTTRTRFLTNEEKEYFIENFQAKIYKISSYDLNKNIPEEKLKNHTKLWLDFWEQKNTQNYTIQINPEIKISFIQKKDSWRNNSKTYSNRKQTDRFIITTSIKENAWKKSHKIPLQKEDHLISYYENFQKNDSTYPEKYLPYEYYLDIMDHNQCILSVQNKADTMRISLPYLSFQEKFYTHVNKKQTPLYKNISYILEEKKYFQKYSQNYLNITSGKIMKGNIYLNGDMTTYLQLKLSQAKRKILDLFLINSYIWEDIIFQDYQYILWNIALYHFDEKYEKIHWKEYILNELNRYKKLLNEKGILYEKNSITDIQNLKNALGSNIIGIIFSLQEKFPGNIIIRNMQIEDNNYKNEEFKNVIEQKILKKLASLWIIPSNFWDFLTLKKKKIISQLGIVHFEN